MDGKLRKHIPDYLLITEQGPMAVDVKPLRRLSKPEVAFTFDWTRRVVESRGGRYEVWSEPPTAQLENIRFLVEAIAGTGCSARVFWTSFSALTWMESCWGRSRAVCPAVRSHTCGPPFTTCYGQAAWSPASTNHSAPHGCCGPRHEQGRGPRRSW